MFRPLLGSSSGISLKTKITHAAWQYIADCDAACVTLVFKRIPEDDPNRDRKMLE
jgi:hypothetical protein